jgi:nucleotide-binding universal stress UspA family protein
MFKPKAKPEFNIILAVDNSDDAQTLTNLLTHIRWPLETAVQVLAFVLDRLPEMNPDPKQQIDEAVALERWRSWAAAKIVSDKMAAKLRDHHLAVTIEICEGQIPEVILTRSMALATDLVAIDLKKYKELTEFQAKISAPRSAQHPPSLLVAQPSRQIRPLTTILVIDDSAEAWRAVEFICMLSLPQWAKIIVLNVIKEQAAIASMPELARTQFLVGPGDAVLDVSDPITAAVIDRLHRCGTRVWSRFRLGHPVDEILTAAQEQRADLIVIGTRYQRRNQPFYMDELAQEIIRAAPCSVLAIC